MADLNVDMLPHADEAKKHALRLLAGAGRRDSGPSESATSAYTAALGDAYEFVMADPPGTAFALIDALAVHGWIAVTASADAEGVDDAEMLNRIDRLTDHQPQGEDET